MIFNCELCQSDFSVLLGRIIMRLSKMCFLRTYLDKMIIQQRLMFFSKFSFKIFLLMFFPFSWNVFPNILKIYELPKINYSIPKYCQTLVWRIIITRPILCHNFISLLNYNPINFIENVPLGAKNSFGTNFQKILSRILF